MLRCVGISWTILSWDPSSESGDLVLLEIRISVQSVRQWRPRCAPCCSYASQVRHAKLWYRCPSITVRLRSADQEIVSYPPPCRIRSVCPEHILYGQTCMCTTRIDIIPSSSLGWYKCTIFRKNEVLWEEMTTKSLITVLSWSFNLILTLTFVYTNRNVDWTMPMTHEGSKGF